MNNATRTIWFGGLVALVICGGAAWAVAAPLEPVLPPDAAGEGSPATSTPKSAAGLGQTLPDSVRGGTSAPAMEDITGQPLASAAGSPEGGEEPVVGESGPDSAGPPPGFALPAVLSTRAWFQLHDWYSETDGQVLNHSRQPRNSVFVVDTADGRIFQRNDLSLGIAGGAHITVGSYLGEDYLKHDHSLEFTFQGLDSWDGHFIVNAANQSTPDVGTNFGHFGSLINTLNFENVGFINGADFYHVEYHSELNGAELNMRVKTHYLQDQLVYDPDDGLWNRHINNTTTLAYLVGVRYVNLDERLNAVSGLNTTTGTIDGFPASAFGGNINSTIQNNLAGLQTGFQLDYQHERWFFGVRGKTAACLNFASNHMDIVFNDPVLNSFHLSNAKTGPAAVSELNLLLGYQIAPQTRLRVSYDFEWLTSVGLAPNQLALQGPNGPSAITVSNGLFLNGASIGLDYIW